jgi:hypothetical protein
MKLKQKFIIFFLIMIVFVGSVFFLRFVIGGDEDTWICQNGVWIKHGNPSKPIPSAFCPGQTTR